MSLEIIIKTCNGETLHGKNNDRFCKTDKKTLILKCINSIVCSASERKGDTKITVIDDASDVECINSIENILKKSPHPYNIIVRKYRDYNEATLQYFQLAKESNKKLVYCVEDDYLHFPNAIRDMEAFYEYASRQMNYTKDIVIHPFDDPDNYKTAHMQPCYLVQYENRHWRTNYYTTCTFFTTPNLVNRGWVHFENFANNYGKVRGINEDSTINKIWKHPQVQLFSPLPSLAQHMQFENNIDKLIDWKKLWNSVPEIDKCS